MTSSYNLSTPVYVKKPKQQSIETSQKGMQYISVCMATCTTRAWSSCVTLYLETRLFLYSIQCN